MNLPHAIRVYDETDLRNEHRLGVVKGLGEALCVLFVAFVGVALGGLYLWRTWP